MPLGRAWLCAGVTIVSLLSGARHGVAEQLQSPAQQPATTAFVDVAVVPMDRERVLPHQTVVVQGERILRMGPADKIAAPRGAQRVDGRGKYLLPGLADMHAHPWIALDPAGDTSVAGRVKAQRILLLYLANGVTTLRVMGYAGPPALALRDAVARGAIPGPRLYVGVGPADDVAPDTAAQYVANARQAGFDFVKVHGGYGPGVDSVVAAAHRLGLPVAGHPSSAGSSGNQGIPDALRWHMASVEHQIGLDTPEAAQRYAAALKAAGVWVCPTLVNAHNSRHGTERLRDPTWPELRYWSDAQRSFRATLPAATAAQQDTLLQEQRAIKRLHDAGVGLLLGTDAPATVMFGFGVHRELEALVAAGLTPYEALLTGTRNVAAYFGTLDSAGTIAAGNRADLVLVTDNPLTDIRHTAQPAGVMYGGHWLPRAELDRQLHPLEGFYAPQ